MGTLEERIEALERQVRIAEDTLAIYQLVASYGPCFDGGAISELGQLWTEDCWYDVDATPGGLRGRPSIQESAVAASGLVGMGFAHFVDCPVITINGDTAVATCHSNTFHGPTEDGSFHVARVSANRFELERVNGRWLIKRRLNRLLNGSSEAREILAQGARETAARVGNVEGSRPA
jgi:SnoaL-like domain